MERLQQRYLYLFNEQIDIKDRLNALDRSVRSVSAASNDEELAFLSSKLDTLESAIFQLESLVNTLSAELNQLNQRMDAEPMVNESRTSGAPFFVVFLTVLNLLFLTVLSVLFYLHLRKPILLKSVDSSEKPDLNVAVKTSGVSENNFKAEVKEAINGSNADFKEEKKLNYPRSANREVQLELLYKEAEILVVKMKNETLDEEKKAKYEHLFNETYDKILELKNI